MNWNQLYASATHEERLEILFQMMRTIEARQHRWVLAKGWLVRNRRHTHLAHFIGDRRSPLPQWRRAVLKTARHLSIGMSLFALTAGVIIFAMNVSPMQAILTILGYEVAIVALMYYSKSLGKRFYLAIKAEVAS